MPRLSERIIRLTLIYILVTGVILVVSKSSHIASYVPTSTSFNDGEQESSHSGTPQEQSQQQLKDSQNGVTDEDSNSLKSQIANHASSFSDDSSVVLPVAGYVRENATFVSLVRNKEIWSMAESIRSVEDRFNHKYHYDWVFLNEEEFTEEFKTLVTTLISGTVKFGLVPHKHWSYPDYIDQSKAADTREKMKHIIYGSSEPYRHMCRYQSGFFFQEEVMQQYKYYWRVEPETKLHCDVNFDVFKFMRENDKDYAFTISIKEFESTIPTLWETTKEFIKKNPETVAKGNLMNFISNDDGDSYNLCHYWTNFEVANMDFWRGEAYQKYFEHLDRAGGFFYERWGDAPVHSLAASLFLPQEKVHFFEQIGYYHGPYNNCPIDDALRKENKCLCDPSNDFTWKDYSCTRRYFDVLGLKKPKGWEGHTG
jgi:alpha 1,2-mannosyltransferase